jgi:hypothetical protein
LTINNFEQFLPNILEIQLIPESQTLMTKITYFTLKKLDYWFTDKTFFFDFVNT